MMFVKNPLANARTCISLLALAVLCGAGVLVWKLYQIQVINGGEYADRMRSQSTTSVLLPPARGVIVDRRGLPLADNKASIDMDLYLNVLVGDYLRGKKTKRPLTAAPGVSGRQMTDVAKIVDDSARDAVRTLGFDMDNLSRRDILRHYDQKPNVPLRIARNLDFATLSRIAEHNISVPGLEETARPVRNYPHGAFAAHLLGHVGKLEDVPTDASYVPDVIGKDGLEKSMDAYLQGVPGAKMLRKNLVGYIMGVDAVKEPQAGGTVYLSLDARIQMIAEQEMRKVGRGACVIMNPADGDILAMVSVPNYDPNTYSVEAGRLNNDATAPLINRAITGYPVGSEFKIITAMAAFRNPAVRFTSDTSIDSPAAVYIAGRWFKDWANNPGQGVITLKTALQWSTNTFFYQLGVRTGIKSIQEAAAAAGMGARLLVDEQGNRIVSSEAPGVIPGPELFKQRNAARLSAWEERRKQNPQSREPRPLPEVWNDGNTVNTSIGQGDVEVTPLQLATLMCAVANGGTVYYPRLVLRVANLPDNADGDRRDFPPRVKGKLGLTAAQLRTIQEGLRAVVVDGTGKKAAVKDFPVAGKTGTAQFWMRLGGVKTEDYKTWFNGYAPYDQPRYVVTVLVEGGAAGGGGTCGPIAARIFKRLAELERGADIDLPVLPPAMGHFLKVGGKPTPADSDAVDESPSAEAPAAVPEFSVPAAPPVSGSKPTDGQRKLRGR